MSCFALSAIATLAIRSRLAIIFSMKIASTTTQSRVFSSSKWCSSPMDFIYHGLAFYFFALTLRYCVPGQWKKLYRTK